MGWNGKHCLVCQRTMKAKAIPICLDCIRIANSKEAKISEAAGKELSEILEVVRKGLIIAHDGPQCRILVETNIHSARKMKFKVHIGSAADCYIER